MNRGDMVLAALSPVGYAPYTPVGIGILKPFFAGRHSTAGLVSCQTCENMRVLGLGSGTFRALQPGRLMSQHPANRYAQLFPPGQLLGSRQVLAALGADRGDLAPN